MKIFNTQSKEKEEFVPLEGKRVKMYVCGPTVYDHAHLGHARAAVAFDVIRRFLEHEGFHVISCRISRMWMIKSSRKLLKRRRVFLRCPGVTRSHTSKI